jgi:putative ABC transport system permease protein
MSLLRIAWRSIEQRGVASLLTAFSMALGVMLVVAVLTIHGVVSESFRNNSSLGYNMIVGAKGGKLQLTLNTVYYLSSPIENIPYDYYLEFFTAQQRAQQWKNSIAYHARDAQWNAADAEALSLSAGTLPGPQSLAALLVLDALKDADSQRQAGSRDGKFGMFTYFAIPVCLGDYYGKFRVVGTTPAMFDDLVFDVERDRKFEFAQGRNFQHKSAEHGYFEAVVGSTVAREMKVKLGGEISPAHGDPEGHGHERKFTIVGILKPSGTPNDRAVFVNMEGFYLMEDHAKPIEAEPVEGASAPDESDAVTHDDAVRAVAALDDPEPLPVEQREVTAILLRTINPLVTPGLQNNINEGPTAQAVLPVMEIYNLFAIIVKPIQWILLVLTAMICFVSGISILVSIYNSMSDRRHEIAVMRALGAGRGTVMTIILLESMFLSLGGGIIGFVAGHALNAAASPWVEDQTGVSIGFLTLAPPMNVLELFTEDHTLTVHPELLLVPALILLAIIVGFLPALSAYRTDVAKSLGD